MQNHEFSNEFFSGSSGFKDEIWSEMESLCVLDVFCTTSECFVVHIRILELIFYFITSIFEKKNKKRKSKNFKCLKNLNKHFQKEIFLKSSFLTNFCNDLSESFATKFSKDFVTMFE